MRSSKLFLGFLIVALATMSWAQTATTSLRGTVTDAGGAVIPKATVTLSRAETGFTRTVTTDDQGSYQFLQIPPATYTLEASAASFAKATQGVQLLVNTPSTVDIKLGVEAASTTIDVSGEAPLVNTQDASLGAAFNNQQILALPFEGRDPVGILSLQPGVTYVTTSENSDSLFDTRGGAVNGARSDQTNVTLDGVDNNDQVGGTAFSGALRSTLDSLQEFRVVTSSATADSGRSSGGQVSMVTKSGTNNIHGALYEYHRPTIGRANDWFNKQAQLDAGEENKPAKFIRNTFGGAVGGPIIKDRLFFFGTYEGQRKRESVQVTRTLPTETLRQGILQYVDEDGNIVALSPTDIASMDFCTASCPWGPGPNPNVLQYWSAYPTPNNFSVGDGLNLAGYTFAAPIPQNFNNYIAKFDWNATASGTHRLFARLNILSDRFVPGLAGAAQFAGQPASFESVNTSKGIALGYTATLSNTLINNFRYGYIRQQTSTGGPNQEAYIDFRGIDEPIFFGSALSQAVPVHNFVDDLVWTKRSHTFQFGGNWRLITNKRQSNAQNFFNAVTNPSWTENAAIAGESGSLDPGANGFAPVSGDFAADYDIAVMGLMGIVPEVTSQYNVDVHGNVIPEGQIIPRNFRNNEFEFYVQDSWRAKPNLTFTLGLRYTLLQPPYETSGNQVSPTTSLHDWFEQRKAGMLIGEVVNPLLTFDVSGQANGKKPYWDWDKSNFAPRFSFAFSPNAEGGFWKALFGGPGRSSIRGGYGIYFDHFGIGVVNSFDKQGSFGLTTSLTNPAGLQSLDDAPRFEGQGQIPQSLVLPAPSTQYPVTPPADLDSGFAITWGLDDKLKTPYSHAFDFSITRELPGNFVVEAAYVGRLGRRLLQQLDLAMPLNLVDPQSGMDYFTAATMLAQAADAGTPIDQMAPIPYFENLFANAAGPDLLYGYDPTTDPITPPCTPGALPGTAYSATQNMYEEYYCNRGNETTALFVHDLFCYPGCANGETFQFFSPQYSSLYAWSSVGSSSYHAGQFTVRRRMTSGLQFDLNYTLSKSMDMGSDAERLSLFDSNSGGFGQIINSWNPRQNRAVSDFDARHSINANYVYELPFGRKRSFGSGWSGVVDAIFGGWQSSGVFRWSSGLPFSLGPGLGFWPTNWELTGFVVPKGKALPKTGVFDNGGTPNVFQDSAGVPDFFRFAYPGETGNRNILRGPGIFNIDLGLAKNWNITESQRLQFRWEVFNITNSVRFDALSMSFYNGSITNSGVGNFLAPTNSVPRVMQFALRYQF